MIFEVSTTTEPSNTSKNKFVMSSVKLQHDILSDEIPSFQEESKLPTSEKPLSKGEKKCTFCRGNNFPTFVSPHQKLHNKFWVPKESTIQISRRQLQNYGFLITQ